MKRVVIVGSSIAGASAALLLSKDCEVRVYDQKKRREIGEKLCGNVCTEKFGDLIRKFGLDERKFIKKRYSKAVFYGSKNNLTLSTREYEIDRKKLIESLIFKAERNGAKFVFSARLEDINVGKSTTLLFKKGNEAILEKPDVVVGADGALSAVAKHFDMGVNRKHFLVLQANFKERDVKKLSLSRDAYNVFLGKKFGHYAYVFPIKDGVKVGLGDHVGKDVKKMFDGFVKSLGIKKKAKIKGALVPRAAPLFWRRGVFLIGDAGGYQKFTQGGIIPGLLSAQSLRDVIVYGNYSRNFVLRARTFVSYLITWFINKMTDKDWDRFLEIMEGEEYQDLVERRDWLELKDLLLLFSPKMITFAFRVLFR